MSVPEAAAYPEMFLGGVLAMDPARARAVAAMTPVRGEREARLACDGACYELDERGVARVLVEGPITWGGGLVACMYGFADWERIVRACAEVIADGDARALLLEIDSPGGDVRGMDEACAAVRRVRAAGKPVVALARQWALSAAYILASQADEVVVTEGGTVGCLGVYVPYEDTSAAYERDGVKRRLIGSSRSKGINTPGVPATDDMIGAERAYIEQLEALAMRLVTDGRGIDPERYAAWRDGPKQSGQHAVEAKMADRVVEYEELLAELGGARAPAAAGQTKGPTMATPTAQQLRARAGQAAGSPAAPRAEETTEEMTAEKLREKYPEAVAQIEEAARKKDEEAAAAESENKDDPKKDEEPAARAPSPAADAGDLAKIMAALGEKTEAAKAFAADAAVERMTPGQARAMWQRLRARGAGDEAAGEGASAQAAPVRTAPATHASARAEYAALAQPLIDAGKTRAEAATIVYRDRPDLRQRMVEEANKR